MAKYKKKYYAKKKVLKAIGKYYRTTISKMITFVSSANGTVALAGESAGYTLNNLLGTTSTYQELGKQFALFKLRGVLIQVSPGSMQSGTGMICLALQQTNEENNNGLVYSQPNVFPVSEHQNTRKYIHVGSQWFPTNDATVLQNLKLSFQVVQTFNSNKNWSILIKLYLTFKSSI